MLICQNCSSIQEVGVTRCRHCHMEGQLIPWADQKPDIVVEEVVTICINCGSENPGEADKCQECHFPLPAKRKPAAQLKLDTFRSDLPLG